MYAISKNSYKIVELHMNGVLKNTAVVHEQESTHVLG